MMGMRMNWFPGISQVKSLVQVLDADYEGARQTQIDFVETCPIVSQITSLIQAIKGNTNQARETQIKFILLISRLVDNIPGIGYFKAIIHYMLHDHESGDHAMKTSSRVIGLLGIASVGFYLNDLMGAAVGGVFGGLFMDFITTDFDSQKGAESLLSGKYSPNGSLAIIYDIETDIKHRAGHVFDLIIMTSLDAAAGFSAGVGNNEVSKILR